MDIQNKSRYPTLCFAIKHLTENMAQRPHIVEALNALQHRLDNKGEHLKVSGRAACAIETAFHYARFNISKLSAK